ncbi:magnesium/cobalt transporter CorA [Aureibacter tunicatorum]|uniref:Magnesium transport protein CorA n=1 Tax=Aureibacter tunicatorum TaxID=866807 RepID=A0AAE3XQS0_9BACT|nr:magnesium/cobalt transporter CorA [Aureibacter tunicatorum]MDR6240338.1 magnesium transporter [Aureibacter tunicatorum]BDD05781.1 magnesium transport protein CorA [Aureibacter tunicatorum]
MKRLNRKKVDRSTPVYTGSLVEEPVGIQTFRFNQDSLVEKKNVSTVAKLNFKSQDEICWLNVHGLNKPEVIERICKNAGVHQLVIQDILDVNQRPKFQEFEGYWFMSIKSVLPSDVSVVDIEQVSFVLSKNYVFSFQEKKADYFSHIRQRLRDNVGLVRQRGTDYLFYLMLEAILDNYFKTLSDIEEAVDAFDFINSQEKFTPELLEDIEKLKLKVSNIKKTILPIKDFMNSFKRLEFDLIEKRSGKYFWELRDLCLSLIDQCDQLTMNLESNVNLFFSVQGHRMNQVMKVLTMVATLFIPLTFLVGVYGMNFTHIPGLTWRWSYLSIWIVMLVIVGAMLAYFRRKHWF